MREWSNDRMIDKFIMTRHPQKFSVVSSYLENLDIVRTAFHGNKLY